MRLKEDALFRISFLIIAVVFLLFATLYRPTPERLHGTFSYEDYGPQLVLFEEKVFANEGKFMLYPFAQPEEEKYLAEGTFYLDEHGTIVFHSLAGETFYAKMMHDALLFSEPSGSYMLWQRISDAAIF